MVLAFPSSIASTTFGSCATATAAASLDLDLLLDLLGGLLLDLDPRPKELPAAVPTENASSKPLLPLPLSSWSSWLSLSFAPAPEKLETPTDGLSWLARFFCFLGERGDRDWDEGGGRERRVVRNFPM